MKNKNGKNVRAVIELKIAPQRKTGFGKIAGKVSKYAQVDACFLMSGAYDLLVFASGESLQDVAELLVLRNGVFFYAKGSTKQTPYRRIQADGC